MSIRNKIFYPTQLLIKIWHSPLRALQFNYYNTATRFGTLLGPQNTGYRVILGGDTAAETWR